MDPMGYDEEQEYHPSSKEWSIPTVELMVYHIFQDHSHKTTLNSQIPVAKSQQLESGLVD